MSKEEIKCEISKILDNFSDKALTELLAYLKEVYSNHQSSLSTDALLSRILTEDKELLAKLTQ